jgi:hypothetical protein
LEYIGVMLFTNLVTYPSEINRYQL